MKISFSKAETTKIIISIEDEASQQTSNIYELFLEGTLGRDINFSKVNDVLEESTHPAILGTPAIMNLDNEGALSFLVKFHKHQKGKGTWLALEVTQDGCSNIDQVKDTVKTPDTNILSLEKLLTMKSRKSMTKKLQEVNDPEEHEKERDVMTTAIADSSLLEHFTRPSPGLSQRILWDLVESAKEDKELVKIKLVQVNVQRSSDVDQECSRYRSNEMGTQDQESY